MGRVEQALRGELGFELLKGHLQIPCAFRHQGIAVQLIRPVPGIDGNPAKGGDAHPALRTKAKPGSAAFEHNTAQAALAVLQGEIVVA